MTSVSASAVKELRERTGLGMMDCKRALVEAGGDMDLAIENLRKSSGMKAAKKAGRIAADGLIGSRVEAGCGVIIEVNCETDFAAKNEDFISFVSRVTDLVFENKISDIGELQIESDREELVQKIGENISVRRSDFLENDKALVINYIHGNQKIGVLLEIEGGDKSLGQDLAMHIAAMNPLVVVPEDVSEDLIVKEREIYLAQAEESGKPKEIVEKMVEGRLKKYLAEISLTEQPFVKDGDVKVGDLCRAAGATVRGFVRYEVGEGIEKAEDDFAAEVQKQLNS
ncbi:MAG: elongation factor Ts [Gammaproteobacteria bacterium]|nr:elongation factor Ts [Gammaproteobacteria bacterium]